MKAFDLILSSSLIVLCCFSGYFFYSSYQQFISVQQSLSDLENKIEEVCNLKCSHELSSNDSECNTAVSSQLWERLQKGLQNTVIQLLVTNVEHNVLQPYKVPKPGQCLGSGFIINQDGEIITNAHVVNGATSIMAQMPAFGKHQFEVDLVGIMPEKDFALLKFRPEDLKMIQNSFGKIPALELGDSDTVARSQEILALGYPLGQQSLKSTTGVISGRETGMIQMSAPINPGSSGGPSLNCHGQVIGINTSSMMGSQNVNYIIPINDLKIFLKDLRAGGLVRKPYIGVYQSMATVDLLKALGNPLPGGTYVVEVLTDSPLYQQLLPGDMIYEVNGLEVDLYGEVTVPWSEDKISTAEYISRLEVGQKVYMVVYRRGKKMKFECIFDRKNLLPIRQIYPEYEELPFEAFGGYIVMPLMLNHLPHLAPLAPSLAKYGEDKYQIEPLLVVTHVIPDSPAYRARLRLTGSILKKVNGRVVKTLSDLKKALLASGEIVTIETDDHILVAIEKEKILKAERGLAQMFGYTITDGMQALLDKSAAEAKKRSAVVPTKDVAVAE
jgi:serine protease Do